MALSQEYLSLLYNKKQQLLQMKTFFLDFLPVHEISDPTTENTIKTYVLCYEKGLNRCLFLTACGSNPQSIMINYDVLSREFWKITGYALQESFALSPGHPLKRFNLN